MYLYQYEYTPNAIKSLYLFMYGTGANATSASVFEAGPIQKQIQRLYIILDR